MLLISLSLSSIIIIVNKHNQSESTTERNNELNRGKTRKWESDSGSSHLTGWLTNCMMIVEHSALVSISISIVLFRHDEWFTTTTSSMVLVTCWQAHWLTLPRLICGRSQAPVYVRALTLCWPLLSNWVKIYHRASRNKLRHSQISGLQLMNLPCRCLFCPAVNDDERLTDWLTDCENCSKSRFLWQFFAAQKNQTSSRSAEF